MGGKRKIHVRNREEAALKWPASEQYVWKGKGREFALAEEDSLTSQNGSRSIEASKLPDMHMKIDD